MYTWPLKLVWVGVGWLSLPRLAQSCLRPDPAAQPELESTASYVSETDSVGTLERSHHLHQRQRYQEAMAQLSLKEGVSS
ncbi:MAG: hypothetical protein ISP86_05065 [Shewanellaceae bacterium]|nr:hypothetical protein [Shewanellaceae bacterium]